MFKRKKADLKEEHIDAPLFEFIQPQGGITFKEPNYILTGDGYVKIINIYQLPGILNDFWMDHIFNIEGTIATADVSTKDSLEVKKNINKAIKKEFEREHNSNDFAEIYDAQKRQAQLQHMFDEIQSMGEVVKMLHFRIFVPGRSLVLLEEKTDKIIAKLESDQFAGAILLNEGKREWQSIFESYKVQHEKHFHIRGHSLMSEQIAGGYPFHYSDLDDEFGTLLGFTPCGGPVIFDNFLTNNERTHYNMLLAGDMGAGKSTVLKKFFEVRAAENDFVRCFDVSGEFATLAKEFGGKIIGCDGSNGILNPLEILRAAEEEETSYANHISKVNAFFKCVIPDIKDDTLIDIQNLLREFYESLGLVPGRGQNITGLAANRYPTFSVLLEYVKNKIVALMKTEVTGLEADLTREKLISLSKIESYIESIVNNYGYIFDGITTVDNIVDEKIVVFDISKIKNLGNIFNAQMFNMLLLCWDNAVANGMIMKELWENNKLKIWEITKFFIIVDESHRWINTRMPMILELIIQYLREARKYFAGIALASQSIRDYMPEGINGENVDMMKTIFELTQYKFLFRQDSAALSLINKVFDKTLTFSQLSKIPMLSRGEAIFYISGDRALDVKIWIDKNYEKPLHKGGK